MEKNVEAIIDDAYVNEFMKPSYNTYNFVWFRFRIEKFSMYGVNLQGIVVYDQNGLPLAS